MKRDYHQTETLRRQKAYLLDKLNHLPYDGTPEVKEQGGRKYLYLRRRIEGRITSVYVDGYTEELYARVCDSTREARALRKELRRVERELTTSGVPEPPAAAEEATEEEPLVACRPGRHRTTFPVGDIQVGRDFLLIAGPCSVESASQIMEAARLARQAGANLLRGGTFKPRTSPYSFQGLGKLGLQYLRAAGDAYGLPVITEVMDTRDIDLVASYADVLQIGTRNMQNFSLLRAVGETRKPVLLKRGMNATIEEWLNCAEYILKGGNEQVMLCERGIRTFETYTRNTLDLGAVAAARGLTHLPIIVDPSHATGRRELILPMSLSAVMAGCDGLEIEMHPHPGEALSDGEQQLTGEELLGVADAVRRTVAFRSEMEGDLK